MEAEVSEIHAYPPRPVGYEEPLFHTRCSRKEILDHFAESGWLCRASELGPRTVESRTVGTRGDIDGRRVAGGHPAGRVGRMGRVLSSWREVDRWWEANGGVDVVWRLLRYKSGRQTVLAESLREAR